MTNQLDKLDALCKARTPGPWTYELYSCKCCAFVKPEDVMYAVSGQIASSPTNAKFIASMGTCADELVAVARATEKLLAKSWQKGITDKVMTGVENDFQDRWFDAKDALAALREKLGGAE